MKVIVALITMLFVSPVWAKVYKCDENGRTVYKDSPCGQMKGGEVVIKPNVVSNEGLRRQIVEDDIAKAKTAETERIRNLERIARGQPYRGWYPTKQQMKQAQRDLGWRTDEDDFIENQENMNLQLNTIKRQNQAIKRQNQRLENKIRYGY